MVVFGKQISGCPRARDVHNTMVFEHEVVGVASGLAEIACCVRGTDVSALRRAAIIHLVEIAGWPPTSLVLLRFRRCQERFYLSDVCLKHFAVVFFIQTNKSKIKFHSFYINEYNISTYLFADVMLRPDTGS